MSSFEQQPSGNSNILWARLSLQAKTLSVFLFVALVPLIGLSIWGAIQTQRALTDAAEISLKGSAAQAAASMDAFIKTSLDSIRVEAQSPDLVQYLSLPADARGSSQLSTRLLEYLNLLDGKDSINILSYGILDGNGVDVLDNNSEHIGGSEAASLYFKEILDSGETYASPVIYREEGSPVLYFASPIRNSERKIIGVLRAEYTAGVIQQIANASAQVGTNVTLIVLDDHLIRQADTSNSDLVLHPIAPLKAEEFQAALSERRILLDELSNSPAANNTDLMGVLDPNATNQFFEADLYSDNSGTHSVATARMNNQPWIVVVSQPRSLLLENAQRQTVNSILIFLAVALIVGVLAVATSRTLVAPLTALTRIAESITSGDLDARAEIQSQDEIGVLARSFNQMADQLSQILSGLEQRVEDRTRALTKRSSQLEAIADVARSITSVQEVDRLLAEITILISERFDFYHVGVFLLDANREYANLRAANSVGGKRMLARNHRLKVGEQGIVGFATQRGEPRIALDVGGEAVYFNNPDLPDTHSEVALPLRIGATIIGALDIQSVETNAFSEEDLEIFAILADQVSVAIQNARSLEQSQRALREAEVASSRLTGQAWRGYSEENRITGYRYDGIKPEAVKTFGLDDDKSSLSLPIQLRGQVIGKLKLKSSDVNRNWTEDERIMLEATAERVAIALESARLLDEAQRRASRESFLSEVGSKLATSFQMDSILRDTVEELGQVLLGSTVSFQLIDPVAARTDEAKSDNRSNSR